MAAALATLAGAGLRLAVPVLPPDASLRAVLAYYGGVQQRAR